MSDENVVKLLDWFAHMSVRVERMEDALRTVMEGQEEARELLADLRADLRVVKSALAHQDEALARHETQLVTPPRAPAAP